MYTTLINSAGFWCGMKIRECLNKDMPRYRCEVWIS